MPNVREIFTFKLCGWFLSQCLQSRDEHWPHLIKWYARCARQLAELVAVRVCDYRDMDVIRRVVAEQSLQPDLARCGFHDVDAAHDFSDAFKLIVYDYGQLVGDQAVAPLDDEVAGFRFEPLAVLPLETVLKDDRCILSAYPNSGFGLLAAIPTGPRVDHAQSAPGCISQVLSRTTTGVGKAISEQLIERSLMRCRAPALEDDVTVPAEPISVQSPENEIGGARLRPWRIDVLNTKKPEPIVDSGLQIACNGGYK